MRLIPRTSPIRRFIAAALLPGLCLLAPVPAHALRGQGSDSERTRAGLEEGLRWKMPKEKSATLRTDYLARDIGLLIDGLPSGPDGRVSVIFTSDSGHALATFPKYYTSTTGARILGSLSDAGVPLRARSEWLVTLDRADGHDMAIRVHHYNRPLLSKVRPNPQSEESVESYLHRILNTYMEWRKDPLGNTTRVEIALSSSDIHKWLRITGVASEATLRTELDEFLQTLPASQRHAPAEGHVSGQDPVREGVRDGVM